MRRLSVVVALVIAAVGAALLIARPRRPTPPPTRSKAGRAGATENVRPVSHSDARTKGGPGGELVPIEIKLPLPTPIGTREDIRFGARVEKPSTKPHEPILAPPGTTNVALEKEVTSSDDAPVGGELEQVTDGDKRGIDGSYVELGVGRQWVQIDLHAVHRIYAIAAWHYYHRERVYHDVVVQVAEDPDFITNVRVLYNNDYDNSSGLGIGKDREYVETYKGRLIEAKGVKARYVRLYSKGNTDNGYNHYVEVEVYGKPAT